MKEQKKGSPLGTLWSWGKAHHGKFGQCKIDCVNSEKVV